MSCLLSRLSSFIAIGFAVKPAVNGDALAVGVIIVACLLYLHAAIFEVVDEAVNGGE